MILHLLDHPCRIGLRHPKLHIRIKLVVFGKDLRYQILRRDGGCGNDYLLRGRLVLSPLLKEGFDIFL